jgi:Ferritin-like
MRHRQERFLSVIQSNADSASVTDVDLAELPGEATGELRTPLARIPADIGFTKPDELTWWDWTVFLLHTAAEIEHALMVQYLYAPYSLGEAPFQGPNVPEDAQTLVNGWRGTIVGIAREEMGHLITVQNLLRFIGGVLNFEREDFPFRSLYPFRFQLEPLTKSSLAKYVAAEMPEDPAQPDELIREIIQRATGSAGGLNVNRVGPLYTELGTIFADSTKLSDNDLFPDTADSFQAKQEDWFAFGPIIVRELRSREDAVNALDEIGEQGEGPGQPTEAAAPSHFDRFIGIYKEYPETDEVIGPVDWIPFRPVPTNPNTLISPSSEALLERGRITHPVSRLWAQLSNVRYRMLLLDIAHALHLEGPMEEMNGSPTMRGSLRDWAFLEMRGQPRAGLRGVSTRLVQLPLKADVSSQEHAAALPFELPYTLALPDRDLDRWRLHLTLINGAHSLIEQIESASGSNAVLVELKAIDLERRRRIEEHLSQL